MERDPVIVVIVVIVVIEKKVIEASGRDRRAAVVVIVVTRFFLLKGRRIRSPITLQLFQHPNNISFFKEQVSFFFGW